MIRSRRQAHLPAPSRTSEACLCPCVHAQLALIQDMQPFQAEQDFLTARFCDLSSDGTSFARCLDEMERILGPDEATDQMSLLCEYTCEQAAHLLREEQNQMRREQDSGPGWALSVGSKWCDRIFTHGKSWEIRGCHCRKHLHERIAIARAGTGQLVGEVTIGESREVSWQELEAAVDLHHIQDLSVLRYKKPHAWVLQDVQAYVEPRPYVHPTGCVNWIPLRQTGARGRRPSDAKPSRKTDPRRDASKKTSGRSAWEKLLERRQSSASYSTLQRDEYARAERARLARLARKFPTIYSRQPEELGWMSMRARAFQNWCRFGCSSMCPVCDRMAPQPYRAGAKTKRPDCDATLVKCSHCKTESEQGYSVPKPEDVPRRLRRLRPEVVEALRPFTVHCGREERAMHGYAVHTDMLRFSFKKNTVEAALAGLAPVHRKRGEKALLYLLDATDSAYAKFWRLHHRFLYARRRRLRNGDIQQDSPVKRLPVNFLETVGLECALWPHLYWRTDMTETFARSRDSRRVGKRRRCAAWDDVDDEDEGGDTSRRHSAKASFLAKARSSVLGYATDGLLLQYVYDLWLFTTVGGARNSTSGTTREALASKPYSPELWKHYHAALVDLQKQLGLPQLFVTVAPYEWSLPYHVSLEDELYKCLRQRLHGPTAETLHVAHVLSQAVKGLLTGANERARGPQHSHVFSTSATGSVRAWVARLEFQDGKRQRRNYGATQAYHGRGAVHVHILLWLQDMERMDLAGQIRADIPGDDEPQLRDLVLGSQLDWTTSGWPLRKEPTRVSPDTGLLELHHPEEAYAKHCRAYLVDVLSALQCHVDVIASDGRSMILKYCASTSFAQRAVCSFRPGNHLGYLPKFSSSFAQEMLNDQATGFSLARRILSDYHPLQPEMVLQLAAQQLPQFLSPAVVRKFCVPVPWLRDPPKLVRNYMASPWRRAGMSLLQYLRLAGANGQIAQCYRRHHRIAQISQPLIPWINTCPELGKILVACNMYSYTSHLYFGQWLILHVPFKRLEDLWDDRVNCLPEELRYLGLCLLHRPTFWRTPVGLVEQMETEARTASYIKNVVAQVQARIELVDAYLSGQLQRGPADATPPADAPSSINVSSFAPEQSFVYTTLQERVQVAMRERWPDDADEDAWRHWLLTSDTADVRRPLAVLGPAGSGKSTAVQAVLRAAVRNGARVGVACPTGLLASRYKIENPDLDVDTLHGMFALHKPEIATLEMMSCYDLIVIDEIGQVPLWVFERILRLWDASERRTALVFVGDFCQLRGPDGTLATQSLRWPDTQVLHLRSMRRCKCDRLRWKLELLRGAVPSGPQLKKLLRGHSVDRSGGPPTFDTVAAVLAKKPTTQFVTISRRGSAVLNALATRALFGEREPLGVVLADPDDNSWNFRGLQRTGAEPVRLAVFEGMRVTITRNEDKQHGFVNGMGGCVRRLRRSGVEVLLDNGKVALVHPTTQEYELSDGSTRSTTALPLRPGYSTTLHKIQGATLEHLTIWLDVPFVRGAAYVALSRVRKDQDWQFLGAIHRKHCMPAECP